MQSSCCYVLWNCFKRSPYFMSVISTITPKPIPKVQTKASILKFSQQNLFLKMFFKLFHLWLTQFLFYIFPHCSTFFFINEIFKGILFLMVQNYYVIRSQHRVKSVQIRSYFWSVFSCIWTEYRKIWSRKKPRIWTLFTQCNQTFMIRMYLFFQTAFYNLRTKSG